MSISVKISDCLLSRIAQVKVANKGKLYGLTQNNATIVLGFSLIESIEKNLPYGCKELGQIEWQSEIINNDVENSNQFSIVHFKCSLRDSNEALVVLSKNKAKEWEAVKHEIFAVKELWKEWVCLRTKFSLKFSVENASSYHEEIKNLLNATKTRLLESKKPVLKIDKTEIVLKKDKGLIGIGKNGKVSAALQQTKQNEVANSELNAFQVMNIILAPGDEESSIEDISKVFSNIGLSDSKPSTQIDFDALALVRTTMGANQLHEIVLRAIERNLDIVLDSVTNVDRSMKTFVFQPKEIGHFISFVYPASSADDDKDQVARRKQNHINLNLSRPCMRRDDVYTFEIQARGTHLINPHVGLKNLVKDGKQYIVKGEYAYHHYMQDDFNDNGWGCAYRSFQTVFSWYRLQGYTSKPVPTHGEIQKCLIDLGDKPQSFLNSRQWIGSTEVSMTLQHFLDVDSRIVHVKSGADMAQHGPTFAQHFTTYGTPVMIGGGVLAHTILGVDYNSQTNELKFLVLDPHYTGDDDLDTVQKKGWCGWKPVTFWDKKSYYNCCMPMFPNALDY